MNKTDLSKYNNSDYHPGGIIKRGLWYGFNICFFLNPWCTISSVKRGILRMFGAKIGKGVIIKPRVNIKYPWLLSVGNYSWIGEKVWIDNLAKVEIGKNCCLSQGVILLCGNHNYKKTTFDLIIGAIILKDGVWIGAQSLVTAGTTCESHAVLAVHSVASGILDAYKIYRGNPAIEIKKRIIEL